MLELINDFFTFLNQNSGSLLITSNIVLIAITGSYVYLTKKILDSNKKNLDLSYSPVIGIQMETLTIGPVYSNGRRNFSAELTLVNVGNAPAIKVLIDSEIKLKFTDIQGKKSIPARFEPSHIPYIREGEEKNNINQSFGNNCVSQMIFDFLQENLLNKERIQNNPSQEAFNSTKLHIYVYYKNHLNQYFMSIYETNLHPWSANGILIPGFAPTMAPSDTSPTLPNDQRIELRELGIPRAKFVVTPIDEEKMNNDIKKRDEIRNLCGW